MNNSQLDTVINNAMGGLIGAVLGEFTKASNLQVIADDIIQPNAMFRCKSNADPAIAALKAYKNGVISKDQALRICAIALEDSGKTVDVDSIAILEKLFN